MALVPFTRLVHLVTAPLAYLWRPYQVVVWNRRPRPDLDLPRADKRLLAILETDGCLADGVAAATGCAIGHRTLRVEDLGKVAATFVDVRTEQAVRVWPRPAARALAAQYAPEARNRWQTYLLGYQRMPVDCLLAVRSVELVQPVRAIMSRPGKKAVCQVCQEEIFNEREVVEGGRVLCQSCAHGAYFRLSGTAGASRQEGQEALLVIPGSLRGG